MMEKGKRVSIEYTVYLEDGLQIDTNVGEAPLVLTLGSHQIFPAVERALIDLGTGDTKQIIVRAEEAFGPVIPDAFREVDLDAVPTQFRQKGAVIGLQDPAGGVYPVRVHDIKEDKVVLDFNHPLAGKNLRFDVKVVSIG